MNFEGEYIVNAALVNTKILLYCITVDFGWINIFGAVIAVFLLIPYIIFEIKYKERTRRPTSALATVSEKILWGVCCFLMVVNVGFFEFGFQMKSLFVIYLIGNAVLLIVYYIVSISMLIKPTLGKRVTAAVVALLVFCLSGVTLANILLIVFASLFGTCHIFVASQDEYE